MRPIILEREHSRQETWLTHPLGENYDPRAIVFTWMIYFGSLVLPVGLVLVEFAQVYVELKSRALSQSSSREYVVLNIRYIRLPACTKSARHMVVIHTVRYKINSGLD